MPEVLVIDYGMGNLRSITNALRAVGGDVEVSSEPHRVDLAPRLVLPGVGAFGRSMLELRDRALIAPIQRVVEAGKPFLGICLGFQVFFECSTEYGAHDGLGFVSGRVNRFEGPDLIVPHMGWNRLDLLRDHALLKGIHSGAFVYFVHSYRPTGVATPEALATSDYGGSFVAAVARDNLAGFQFHPEKSGRVGLRMLENFLAWRPR
jgi:glutamine amidotransferase